MALINISLSTSHVTHNNTNFDPDYIHENHSYYNACITIKSNPYFPSV